MSACIWPGCPREIDRYQHCFLHANLLAIPKPEKEVYRIPQRSAKRVKEQPVYRRIVAKKTEDVEGVCQLQGPTCTYWAAGGDHSQNRSPANYLDPENIEPACNNCNGLKVLSPELFRDHVVSRFKK